MEVAPHLAVKQGKWVNSMKKKKTKKPSSFAIQAHLITAPIGGLR